MIDDVFCRIISGELPADIVERDAEMLVIKDIKPAAPVHLLIMPIAHADTIADVDATLLGRMMKAAHRIAGEQGLDKGYRILINEGVHGGKLVPHFHIHLLGGKPLGTKLVADEHI
jgi:histidine triad (HIT) family protein